MKRHDIIFRSTIVTNQKVRRNIWNFFKRTDLLKSRFIKLSINLNSGSEITVLVKETIVNRTIKEEINTLIRNLIDSLVINQISLKTRDSITIFYTESDSKSYFNYQNSFKAYGRKFYSSFRRTSLAKRFYSTKASKFEFKFVNLAYPISDSDFNLTKLTENFFSEVKGLKYISVIANVKLINGNRFSLGSRYPLDLSDLDSQLAYIDYFNNKYALLDNHYKIVKAENIIFNYTQISEDLFINSKSKLNYRKAAVKSLESIDFRNEIPSNLPVNTNYSTWGRVNKWIDSKTLQVADLKIDKRTVLNRRILITYVDYNTREVEIHSNIVGTKVQSFTDIILNSTQGEFKRVIGETTYHVINGKVHFIFEKLFNLKEKFSKGRKDKKFNLNMITLDVETYINSENNMELYCLSYYDGIDAKSFYITDYSSVNELIFDALRNLLVKANSSKNIYIHNSSNFDLIFLLKHIANFPGVEIDPLIKDGKFINLKIKFGSKKEYSLNMKDSFLLLPISLRKLAEYFKVDTLKSIFPYLFVDKSNLNYIGPVPNLEFFEGVSEKDFNSYSQDFVNNDWKLKKEAIKYCETDCIALYKVIESFAKFIFDLFQINITSISTLPSLALKIFRVHFLSKSIILPIFTGKVYDAISQAYYGGHVDMYIPQNPKGKLVYHYDVNGLYPQAMRAFDYPTNIFAHFVGNISMFDQYENLFKKYQSFIKVKVTAPLDIKHPILPYKKEGITVYGVGSWVAWYHSNEIRNAIKHGYRFEVLEGYLFESADLFSTYVEKLHAIKEQASSGNPMYLIAKLLLNSLYGRFGMSPKLLSHIILSKDELSNFLICNYSRSKNNIMSFQKKIN